MPTITVEAEVHHHAIDAVTFRLELIEAHLITHNQVDHQGGTDADGKTQHMNEGEDLVTPKASESDSQVIFEHKSKGIGFCRKEGVNSAYESNARSMCL